MTTAERKRLARYTCRLAVTLGLRDWTLNFPEEEPTDKKAAAAVAYAEAAYRKGIKINFDTSAWRSISLGDHGHDVQVDTQVIEPAAKKDSGPSP